MDNNLLIGLEQVLIIKLKDKNLREQKEVVLTVIYHNIQINSNNLILEIIKANLSHRLISISQLHKNKIAIIIILINITKFRIPRLILK